MSIGLLKKNPSIYCFKLSKCLSYSKYYRAAEGDTTKLGAKLKAAGAI